MEDGLTGEILEKTTTRRRRQVSDDQKFHARDAIGWIIILFAIGILLMLVSYDPTDPSFFTQTSKMRTENVLGPVGSFTADFCIQLFGFCSYIFPFLVLYLGIQIIKTKGIIEWYLKMTAVLMVWFAILVILGGFQPVIFRGEPIFLAGIFGIDLWVFFTKFLNPVGTYLLLLALCGCAFLMATQWSLAQIGEGTLNIVTTVKQFFIGLSERIITWVQSRKEDKVRDSIMRREIKKMKGKKKPKTLEEAPENEDDLLDKPLITESAVQEEEVAPHVSLNLEPKSTEPAKAKPLTHIQISQRKQDTGPQESFHFVQENQEWVSPSTSFFNPPKAEHKIDENELVEKAQRLQDKFEEFGVTGDMKAIHPGPVVTTYEFRPDAGIKYSKIVNLQDDLCLALGAESVRIDRMPGRYSIGMEVPNTRREIITFREMVEHSKFREESSKLILSLGKTIDGSPYFANLASMPHLLIAGQTGSGKSVGINAMICSVLMRASPQEVKFIMIDPKMVEMGIYADIPHLLTPVVTDPQEASNALKWAVMEMEDRYKKLAANGFRNLEQFNKAAELGNIPVEEGQDAEEPLPFIVVVIDELADLMMVARGEVEESIARIAQKSRAVGIHLILATQRPSVDIITGVIKSNLPSRLSYRVAQRNDSRIILDGNGAEKLLGKGDGLFLPPGTSRLVRIHAPFLSEPEIMQLIKFLKKQGQPTYQHEILKTGSDESGDEAMGSGGSGRLSKKDDVMYEKAARLVVRSGQASVSYIQRKLGLGFARAAKLVDMMEEDGIVGPNVGSKARDILVPADYFDGVDGQIR